MALTEQHCIPCRGGIAPLTFAEALAYVNRVGALAEAEGHHPDITFGWGYCTVVLYTHKIKGLHANDFIMADKCDAAYAVQAQLSAQQEFVDQAEGDLRHDQDYDVPLYSQAALVLHKIEQVFF